MAFPNRAEDRKDAPEEKPRDQKAQQSRGRRLLRTLGLGLITGAADDDPSAIRT